MTDGERKDSAAAAALSVEVPATSDEGGFAVGGGRVAHLIRLVGGVADDGRGRGGFGLVC